jgi:lipid A ethanolaminephosphotransferase
VLRARPVFRVEALLAFVAIYLVAFGNGSWWRAVTDGRELGMPSTWLFLAACAALLVAIHYVLLAAVTARVYAKPLMTAIIVATAAAAYYMSTYSVVLDPTMMRNVMKTDVRETRELLSWSLVGGVALFTLPPLLFVWWVRIERRPVLRSIALRAGTIILALVLACGAFLSISRDFTALMRNRRELRYLVTPGNLIYSFASNLSSDLKTPQGPLRVVGADAKLDARVAAKARPTVFVFVLGETARAADFSLFGYNRETNPELARLAILKFARVTACGTSTEVSVPCMFSAYGRHDYDEQLIRRSEGLLHVLQRAGYAVKWRDNQSGCKGVCDVPGADYRKLDAALAPDLCRGDECFDEILVRSLREDLRNIRDNTVIVLHMMGNHGPAYFRRYPDAFRKFQPDCRTAELRECSREEVVNAFDNVIVYTDHVLAETIKTLESASNRFDTSLFYVSDHGESLGESGLYLHGIPYAVAPENQKRVPMLSWFSPPFAAMAELDLECVRAHRDDNLSHDNVFHSLLGLLGVRTSAYLPERDMFAPCRAQPR